MASVLNGLVLLTASYVFPLIDLIPHIAMAIRPRGKDDWSFSNFCFLFGSFTKFLQTTHSLPRH